jgi:hypothetical protein
MTELKFNAEDLFRSNRIALSIQRIWLQFIGLVVGYLGYYGFTVASFLMAGYSYSQVASEFGLFPCLFAVKVNPPLISKIVFGCGCFYLTVVFLVGNIAVSRATFMAMKGRSFYTWREALVFALRKSGSAVLTPLGIAVIIMVFILSACLFGLFGRMPYVGELGISFFALIWMIAALLMVFFLIVAAASVLLAPAILATTNEDAFEAIFQSFSTIWSQPWRVVFYESIVCGLSAVGFVILAILVKSSFLVMNFLFLFSMGDKFERLAAQGQFLLHSWTAPLDAAAQKLFGDFARHFYFTRDFAALQLPLTEQVSAYFFAINALIVAGLVFSYLLATFNTGNTIMFLILRKVRDGENLLTRQEPENSADGDASAIAEASYPQANREAADAAANV